MRAVILLFIAIALIQTASAYEHADLGSTKTTVYEVPQGYVIFSVYANDIPFKPNEEWSTQTFHLNAFGQTYVLTVKGRAEGVYGAYKHFYVNLTYPNGTVETREFVDIAFAAADYDIKVQYVAEELDWVDVDVYIVLNPFDAATEQPETFTLSDVVPLNKVTFTSDQEAHVIVYFTTAEHWQEIVEAFESGDIAGIVGFAGEQAGNVGWQVYGALCSVPYVGEYACTALDVAGQSVGLVTDVFYWLKFIFIDNGLLFFTLFEALVLAYAALTSWDIFVFFRRYADAHRALFTFIIGIIRATVQIFTSLIQAIGSIIPFT
ncbi:MAG: hypothetical protein DRJ64_09830 [Thermoprotei archaeon]|nr:MAG: hypothetical protein DRJ64_09830 [Thermoprotei archaeon]